MFVNSSVGLIASLFVMAMLRMVSTSSAADKADDCAAKCLACAKGCRKCAEDSKDDHPQCAKICDACHHRCLACAAIN